MARSDFRNPLLLELGWRLDVFEVNHHHLTLVRHFLETAIEQQYREDQEKIKRSKSGLSVAIVHSEGLDVEEPEPAENGGSGEDEEENKRSSFPGHRAILEGDQGD